ncbi:unnamed protein product [Schistocephalus solidus]|uniref:Uncharacterized protein n=1 Tax=Schistocephalus solidus TaxID=70667 RepID=A0A3P7D7X5_SCHSO|nr:unnamed protein product [Schistocephalus solidus]
MCAVSPSCHRCRQPRRQLALLRQLESVPLRLGSPRSSSHLLTPCDAASTGVSLWRDLSSSSLAAEIVGGPGCSMP